MEDNRFIMTTPEFFTNKVFSSREELMNWVKDVAYSVGVVVVTKRSNSYLSGFVYKVVLMCDHGGKYKQKGSIRAPRTRKTDCPFELEAKYSDEYNYWTLTVICDEHNHRPLQSMEGHPYAQRLTQDEFSLVEELTATAVCIGRHQDDWRQIRMDLLDELSVHNARYTAMFNKKGVQSLQYVLNHFAEGFADPPYWMTMPETGLLIASRYNVVVVFLSKAGETTCFPLFTSPPSSQPHDICVIGRVNGNHFVRLVLQGDFPVPPTHPQWSSHAFDRAWENPFLDRQNMYNQIKFPRRNSVGVRTCINID